MEALLMSLAKMYRNKGILLEDLYQEAWVVFLEKPDLNASQICSRVRTRLGRLVVKEYRYNERKHLELLQPEPIETPEEIIIKQEIMNRINKNI